METHCKGESSDECRTALVQVLHKPEMVKHTKRFIPLAFFAVALLVAVVGIAVESWIIAHKEPPSHVKLGSGDINQLEHIGSASKIVYVTAADGTPTTIDVPSSLPSKTARYNYQSLRVTALINYE